MASAAVPYSGGTRVPCPDSAQVMDVNVVGSFNVLQAVGCAMRDAGGGAIVTTASVAAVRGTPTMPAYVASKAALIGMTLTAAKDLAPHNVRVNAVSPALIDSGFMWLRQNELHAASGSPFFSRDPEAREPCRGRTPTAACPSKKRLSHRRLGSRPGAGVACTTGSCGAGPVLIVARTDGLHEPRAFPRACPKKQLREWSMVHAASPAERATIPPHAPRSRRVGRGPLKD